MKPEDWQKEEWVEDFMSPQDLVEREIVREAALALAFFVAGLVLGVAAIWWRQ